MSVNHYLRKVLAVHQPRHFNCVPPVVGHTRCVVVVFAVEAEAGAFTREQFAKGRVGVAVHAFVGDEAAERVPAAVIRKLLFDAAATVVDIVGFQRAPTNLIIRRDAFHAVLIRGRHAVGRFAQRLVIRRGHDVYIGCCAPAVARGGGSIRVGVVVAASVLGGCGGFALARCNRFQRLTACVAFAPSMKIVAN